MPLIALEGPRRVGKGTFAHALIDAAHEVPVVYTHRGYSTPDQMELDLAFVLENSSLLHIWDRTYLSEYVYHRHRQGRSHNTMLMAHIDADKLYGQVIDQVGSRVLMIAPSAVLEERMPTSTGPIESSVELQDYLDLVKGTGWDIDDWTWNLSGYLMKDRATRLLETVYSRSTRVFER